MYRQLLCLFFLFFYHSVLVHSQCLKYEIAKTNEIRTLGELNRTLLSEAGCSLYFSVPWADTLPVVFSDEKMALNDVLNKTLNSSGLVFDEFWPGRIFIFPSSEKKAELKITYLDPANYEMGKTEVSSVNIGKETREGQDGQGKTLVIGRPGLRVRGENAVISGIVRSGATGEPVIGGVITVDDTKSPVTTDVNGAYSIPVKPGVHTIRFHSLGMNDLVISLQVYSDGRLDVQMEESVTELKDIVIVAERGKNITGLQMGIEKLDAKTIRQLPVLFGETDIMKAALLLPGVQTVGEGANGFNVRGGNTDQNLILLDGIPVYNTAHLFGFFSSFNPDIIRDFRLYKSSIPAEYGGRVSSVFDISTRNGNRKKFSVAGGISPVTGKLVLESPLPGNKGSLLASFRTTYSDWLLKKIKVDALRNSKASFYDVFFKSNYDFNEKNNLSLSVYHSADAFQLHSDTSYAYRNTGASLFYQHRPNDRITLGLKVVTSEYRYAISSSLQPVYAFNLFYNIHQNQVNGSISWVASPAHLIRAGAEFNHYRLRPASRKPTGPESVIEQMIVPAEKAIESALFISDEWTISPRLTFYAGIRQTAFFGMGPKTAYTYEAGLPRNVFTIQDTLFYRKNELVKAYFKPEARLSLRYLLSPSLSLKAGYNRLTQYINMMSNTTAMSPTDTWKLCDNYLQPVTGNQYSFGIYADLAGHVYETSAEMYYRDLRHIIEYKGAARLLLNEHIETELLDGSGKAYGIELMVRKSSGKLNGWISYTYARILHRVTGTNANDQINRGKYFPANYDRPHDFTMATNYRFSRRISTSFTLVYSTGRPITFPVGKVVYENALIPVYSKRNEFRIPDQFRCDMSVNLDGNLRSRKLAHGSWSLSVYNLTGRYNVYSVYFVSTDKVIRGYRMSVFPRPIVTLSYNFRFQ